MIYEKFQKYSLWSKCNTAPQGWDLHARQLGYADPIHSIIMAKIQTVMTLILDYN